ncbi:MAG: FGGY family carbohydrate kinase, partial [Gammaproteobacteria bacterium]|nr:FGGY family carbohydrate kinase [Gammaproteobacteria bacterium]
MSAGSTVQDLYLGIDLGTSGCRTIVINAQAEVVANLAYDWPAEIQTAHTWEQGVNSLLAKLADKVALHTIKGICVDGTSGTVMLTEMGRPQEPVLMYNDARAGLRAQELAGIAPAGHPVLSPTSGLAKVLWLIKNNRIATLDGIFHQADWLTNILREYDYEESEKYHRHVHYTDYNNALKTGFDPVEKKWPDWIKQLHIPAEWLPFVVAPGTDIGTISRDYVEQYGFSPETRILAGT